MAVASDTVEVSRRAGYRPAPDAAERVAILRPLHTTPLHTTPVIWCHGASASHLTTMTAESMVLGRRLTGIGLTALGADLGTEGTHQWGNDDYIAAIDDLVAFGGTALGLRTDKVLLVLVSGGGTALNWAWRNPDKVLGVAMGIPLIDMSQVVADNPLGFGTAIEAQYGGDFSDDAATHDPALNADLCEPFGDRTTIVYGLSDPLCLAAGIEAFGEQIGATMLPRDHGHELTAADYGDLADAIIRYRRAGWPA